MAFNKTVLAKVGFLAVIVGATFAPGTAKAAATEYLMLDWDSVQWDQVTSSSSDFQRSVTVGQGTVDLTFDLDEGSKFARFGSSGLTPQVSGTLNGSQSDETDKSLHIQIDPSKKGSGVTMTSSFANFSGASVSDVSFNLFDIDISGGKAWQDLVRVRGFLNGQVVNASFDILNSNKVEANGDTLTGIKSVGNSSDDGNVGVSFGSAIDSFEIFFADGDKTNRDNPANHGIGIGDISFTANVQDVPEPASVLGFLAFGAMGSLSLKKRKQK